MELKNASSREVAELLMPLIVRRLSGELRRKLAGAPDVQSSGVERLAAWVCSNVPESVLKDPEFDPLDLLCHCRDLLKRYSAKDLAAVLGLGSSETVAPTRAQTHLYLPYVDVPSGHIYYLVRRAVATKSFFPADGTPFPTAPIDTQEARGHAQLKPLALDMVGGTGPEYEEELAKLMWKQREELSDTDSDIWDYCNWRWSREAKRPEDFVTVTIDELQTMRGIVKKLNGKGQRGGYKRTQKIKVLNSITHLQNVWLNLFEFDIRPRRGNRPLRPVAEPIQDRAVRIREGGQLDLDGNLSQLHFGFRPGSLFSRYLFGPGRQVALLSAIALRYDPRFQKYEKRLTRYLSWIWRIRAFQLDYLQPLRIFTLLDAIDLPINKRTPSRTLDRLELALNALENDHVISSWQYVNGSPDQNKMRWMNDWLASTILIEPPQIIFDQYRNIGNSQGRAEVVDIGGFADFGERLRDKRLRASLSVMLAAEQSGVSPQDYVQAENGRRSLLSIREKLEKWLDQPIATCAS
jgi:hypothetical protein